MSLGNISSAVTLTVFLMYVIGRIVTIFAVKPFVRDKVVQLPNEKQCYEYGIVEDYPEQFKGSQIYGLIVSKEGMRNIKIYDVDYGNPNHIIPKKGKIVFEKKFLNIDEAIAIWVEPGELVPRLYIEYESMDFLRVTIPWKDNLKNGVVSELIKPAHTWKSVLYLLLR